MSKINSNRANARLSTGPRTPAGKSRSAQSALRHGLSLPIISDCTFSKEVEALAREIAGRNSSTEIQELARRISEAQKDLSRIRYARQQLLSKALSDPEYESCASAKAKYDLIRRLARASGLVAPVPNEIVEILNDKPEGDLKLATILSDMVQELSAIDRYERRALSRRKFAIRAFDAATSKAEAALRPHATSLEPKSRSSLSSVSRSDRNKK
jgi:hypothetical protein